MLSFLILVFGFVPPAYADTVEIEILRLGEKNPVVQYAYDLGGLDFVLTVERESNFDPNAIGDGGTSKGLCQWHKKPEIWNDPQFKDPYWQVEKCLWSYTTWKSKGILHKRLFGYNVRHTVRERFTFN